MNELLFANKYSFMDVTNHNTKLQN